MTPFAAVISLGDQGRTRDAAVAAAQAASARLDGDPSGLNRIALWKRLLEVISGPVLVRRSPKTMSTPKKKKKKNFGGVPPMDLRPPRAGVRCRPHTSGQPFIQKSRERVTNVVTTAWRNPQRDQNGPRFHRGKLLAVPAGP